MDVYGRYIELLTMVYQPTNNTEGAPPCGIMNGGKKIIAMFHDTGGQIPWLFWTPDMDVSKMKRGNSSWGVSSKFGGDKKTPSARSFSHKSQLWLGKTPPRAKYSLSQRGYVRSQIPLLFFHTWIWIPNCL